MGETLLRYDVVRVASDLDDQLTPEQIRQALSSSKTQEDLQKYILSQIKRILHGDNPGTWRDDFTGGGIRSLEDTNASVNQNNQAVSNLEQIVNEALTNNSFEFLASCQVTDSVGDLVYIAGDSIGGMAQVTKADIADPDKMPGVGAIVHKETPTRCSVRRWGVLEGVGFVPGKTYFTGVDGRPTLTRPIAPPGGKVFVQVVGVAMDSTRLLLNPSFNLTRVVSLP